MLGKKLFSFGLLVLFVAFAPCVHHRASAQNKVPTQDSAADQDKPKPLDPNDPRLTFSFSIQPGLKPFRFKVKLDKAGTITGVLVFREGASIPFQNLPSCEVDIADQVNEYWIDNEISQLVKHADLNFDGFEDLELLQYYNPHLGKKLYCIYLWDNKTGHFSYSKELSDIGVNLEAHSENKTLTTLEDWQGGPWQADTYRWIGNQLELIEEISLLGDWSTQTDKKCGFEFSCNRLINGEMVTTLEKPICTNEEMENLPDCPAAAKSTALKVPTKKPVTGKKD